MSQILYKFLVYGPGGQMIVEREFPPNPTAATAAMQAQYPGYKVTLHGAGRLRREVESEARYAAQSRENIRRGEVEREQQRIENNQKAQLRRLEEQNRIKALQESDRQLFQSFAMQWKDTNPYNPPRDNNEEEVPCDLRSAVMFVGFFVGVCSIPIIAFCWYVLPSPFANYNTPQKPLKQYGYTPEYVAPQKIVPQPQKKWSAPD